MKTLKALYQWFGQTFPEFSTRRLIIDFSALLVAATTVVMLMSC